MPLSNPTRSALHAVDDPQGVQVLLEIAHAALTSTVRIVNDTRDLVALGQTWLGFPFEFTLPDDKSGQPPRARLRMDNVGRALTAELERLPAGAALQATVRIVHRSTPAVVDFEMTAPLTGVQVNQQNVTATLGHEHLLRRPAVLLRFDPATAPGVFAD